MKKQKNEPLNYEMQIFSFLDKVDHFDFHGDSLELARDHVIHVLNSDETLTVALFKSKTAKMWRHIDKSKEKKDAYLAKVIAGMSETEKMKLLAAKEIVDLLGGVKS